MPKSPAKARTVFEQHKTSVKAKTCTSADTVMTHNKKPRQAAEIQLTLSYNKIYLFYGREILAFERMIYLSPAIYFVL